VSSLNINIKIIDFGIIHFCIKSLPDYFSQLNCVETFTLGTKTQSYKLYSVPRGKCKNDTNENL